MDLYIFTYYAIPNVVQVYGLPVVGRYLPVHFVAVAVWRVDVIFSVHVFVDQYFWFLRSTPFGHGALFHRTPVAGTHVVDGGKPEYIGPVRFQIFQYVGRV